MREETGLAVEVGALVDEHLFEVLPQRFVHIVAYACKLAAEGTIALSHEHQEAAWFEVSALGERVAGRVLPAGYLGAIRQAACQPLSP